MRVKKLDEELQIVWGEVYAPDVPDVDGDFMSREGVRKMAHQFLARGSTRAIDRQHDNKMVDAAIVESFVAREGDPDFIAHAWVVGVHIADPQIWQGVKNGEYNGFSMQALVRRESMVLELELPEVVEGVTADSDGHTHRFHIRFGDEGEFLGGRTNIVDGHFHKIARATVTEPSEGHAHRFSFVEIISEAAEGSDQGR